MNQQFKSIEEQVIFEKISKDIGNASQEINYGSKEQIYQNIEKMNSKKLFTSYKTIRSRFGIAGKMIIFVKKIIRKCTYFYVEPICEHQSEFNESVTSVVSELVPIVMQHRDELEKSKERNFEITLEKFNERINDLEVKNKYIDELMNQNTLLKEKVIELENGMDKLRSLDLDIFDLSKVEENITTAQAGEDSIILFILQMLRVKLEDCRYLDLGANHAKFLSNTYVLYNKGAKGVLVEANPDLIPELKFYRNRDVVINKCLTNKSGDMIDFYILSGDGLSTFDKQSVDEVIKVNPDIRLVKSIPIETITVGDILEKYFVKGPTVLNVDVEGMEFEIIKNYDFEQYAPLIIIVEQIDYSISLVTEKRSNEISEFLISKGYFEYAYTGINSIFLNREQVEDLKNEHSF